MNGPSDRNSKQHMQQIIAGQFAYSLGREVGKIMLAGRDRLNCPGIAGGYLV
jgi:hypothetical protein